MAKTTKSVENNENSTGEKLSGGITGKGFQPGQSGNPGGRPKRKWLTEVADEMLKEKLEDPAFRQQYKQQLWNKLLASNVVGAMTLDRVWERTEGKMTQPVDVEVSVTVSERIVKAKKRKNHNG